MIYARTGVGARAVVRDSESAALGLPESTGSPGAPAGGAPQYPLKPQCLGIQSAWQFLVAHDVSLPCSCSTPYRHNGCDRSAAFPCTMCMCMCHLFTYACRRPLFSTGGPFRLGGTVGVVASFLDSPIGAALRRYGVCRRRRRNQHLALTACPRPITISAVDVYVPVGC